MEFYSSALYLKIIQYKRIDLFDEYDIFVIFKSSNILNLVKIELMLLTKLIL